MDGPANYRELSGIAEEGVDFDIEVRNGRSGYAIVAPHAGRIEPGSDIIARAIAGNDHGYYALVGKRDRQNRMLHITSTGFDEPRAEELIRRSHTIITVHGCRSERAIVYVGGSDEALKKAVLRSIQSLPLPAVEAPCPALKGIHPRNLCNRGTRGKGVQLELSQHIRRRLTGHNPSDDHSRTALMRFAHAVRRAISNHAG